MSSSKIFKDDPAFTPVSLVSEEKAVLEQVVEQPALEQSPPPEPVPETAVQPEPQPQQPSGPTQEEIEAMQAEAYERGRGDALQEMQARIEQAAEALGRACNDIDTQHKLFLEQSRGDMINLVVALSKKIIGRELTTSRTAIVETLQKAMELAIKHNEYDIWLHPDDLETVQAMVPELIGSIQKLEQITLKTDPDITPGGCRLDSSVCTVDATIEAQLETVREFLEDKGPECINNTSGPSEESQ